MAGLKYRGEPEEEKITGLPIEENEKISRDILKYVMNFWAKRFCSVRT